MCPGLFQPPLHDLRCGEALTHRRCRITARLKLQKPANSVASSRTTAGIGGGSKAVSAAGWSYTARADALFRCGALAEPGAGWASIAVPLPGRTNGRSTSPNNSSDDPRKARNASRKSRTGRRSNPRSLRLFMTGFPPLGCFVPSSVGGDRVSSTAAGTNPADALTGTVKRGRIGPAAWQSGCIFATPTDARAGPGGMHSCRPNRCRPWVVGKALDRRLPRTYKQALRAIHTSDCLPSRQQPTVWTKLGPGSSVGRACD